MEVKNRLKAAGIHFLLTLLVTLCAAWVVFFIWFPSPFAEILGGINLFFLLVVCDLVLGPLISLVIFNSKKLKSELIRDYAIVFTIQAAALIYGLHAMALVRPVFVVLTVDSIDIVSAGDLSQTDLDAAPKEDWRHISWTGPKYVWAKMPEQGERSALVEDLMGGKDLQQLPKYYHEFSQGHDYLLSVAKGLDELKTRQPQIFKNVENFLSKNSSLERSDIRWLPVRHGGGFATVFFDVKDVNPIHWINIDPY